MSSDEVETEETPQKRRLNRKQRRVFLAQKRKEKNRQAPQSNWVERIANEMKQSKGIKVKPSHLG